MNIATALARYDAAWKETMDCESYAAPPIPLYMEDCAAAGAGDSDTIKDTCYHLIKLYCNSGYSLSELLSSASNTADPLDYHVRYVCVVVVVAVVVAVSVAVSVAVVVEAV